MLVYVAGKWEDKERVRAVMEELIATGHRVTHDWTTEEGSDSYTERALNDLRGVWFADALVIVAVNTELPYRGTLVELGAALALGKPVYVIGGKGWFTSEKDETGMIFTSHPLVQPISRWPDWAVSPAIRTLHAWN